MLELHPEGRIESGIEHLIAGKRYAFLALVGERYPARLGAAVENEPGYYPIPEELAHGESMLAVQQMADRMNRELGLSDKEAGRLVASTFAAGRVNLPQPDTGALKRLPARRAAVGCRNATLERIFANPPPRGSLIRFTDGKLKPRPEKGLASWLTSNNSGILVSLRRTSRQIVLRVQSPDSTAHHFRTFDLASPLAFSVERIPVPGELIDINILPTKLRSAERRRQALHEPSRPPANPR